MKIDTIEINNYKAFFGRHLIKIGGKNTFIYGENGSGKSSLYYALKDFFQSSVENIDMTDVENIFINDSDKGKNYIKVSFKKKTGTKNKIVTYELSHNSKTTNEVVIRDANNLKSFLTYKHLLEIHHIKKSEEINLFNLLVKGVLKHFKYTLTNGKELGVMWQNIEELIKKETDKNYRIDQKKKEVDKALQEFNKAFRQLFEKPTPTKPNPEYILDHARPILSRFEHGLDIDFRYPGAVPSADYMHIERDKVSVDLTYAGRPVPKAHLFLNEARLSAIAISVYLGMIKRHPQIRDCKILFLDDIFIGLDIANRLPLLEILKTHFSEYQIFITTYDKPWYEYVKGFLENDWKVIEFYAQEVKGGYEIPKIEDNTDLIEKSRYHYMNCDYKASAVYARSAFEKIIMDYCEKKNKKLAFKKKQKDYSSQDFWKEVIHDIVPSTKAKIEGYRFLIYNKLSHYDPETNPLKSELKDAIKAVSDLRTELKNL